MSRPNIKTLIFATCLTLGAGSALPASAVESQFDYCRIYTGEQHEICQSVLSELKPIKQEDLLEAVKLAVAAVEQQLPQFDALKNVPYADMLVTNGGPCGLQQMPDENPWNMACGPWSPKMVLARELIFGDANVDLDTVGQDPDYREFMQKTFKEVIDLGKADPRYASDDNFRSSVDVAERNYDAGIALLRKAVLHFDSSANVDAMTSDQLMANLKALPEYDKYGLITSLDDHYSEDMITRSNAGLYSTYAAAKYDTIYPQEVTEDTDTGSNSLVDVYTRLVTAATTVDSNFKVDLSSLLDAPTSATTNIPSAPNTGTDQDGELSATIVTVAVVGIASIATIGGVIPVAKGYLFSPLKRRK